MTAVGVTMVKNEIDVIVGVVRHMCHHLDKLMILDNGSTDGTRELLSNLAASPQTPIVIIDDHNPAYYQATKMTRLAERAAADGAIWIVPFDADELWSCTCHSRIADALARLDNDVTVVEASLYNHFATALDPGGNDPFVTMQWMNPRPADLPKVAFRWQSGAQIHQGNHGVTLPVPGRTVRPLIVDHFPYRSADQFIRKAVQGAAAYAATDLPESIGTHWREYGRLYEAGGPEVLEGVFRDHFWYRDPAAAGLVHRPAAYRG